MARYLYDVSSHIFHKSVVLFRNIMCSVNAYGTKGFNEPLQDITSRVDGLMHSHTLLVTWFQ